jgi:tripartite-type tricarboxylate transporter receptor subunit TctC
MKTLLRGMLVALTLLISAVSAAQYPSKPVRVIVPFPPGGSYDVIGRALAQKLSAKWNQPVIVENIGGAGGNIGAHAAAVAAADGYTLLFWGDGVLTNPLIYANAQFQASRDFAGISIVASSPQVLVSNSKSDVKSLTDVLVSTKRLAYGTAGSGTPGHLAGELLSRSRKTPLDHVPYKGGSPALNDLMGGHIDLVYTGLPACMGFIRSGSIRALAVSSKGRSPVLPDTPSVSESISGYDVDTWYGLLAPKATPPTIRQKIALDVKEVMSERDFQKKLADGGFVSVGSTPEELDAKLVRDLESWKVLVAASGAHVE